MPALLRRALATLLLLTGSACFALELTPEERAWLDSHGEIRVGIEPDYPPFDFVDAKGHASGFSTRLLEMAAARAGIRYRHVTEHDWDTLLRLARTGEIDVLPCTRMTADRRQYLHFLEPAYAKHVMGIAAKSTRADTPNRENLPHQVIAIVRGFAVNERLRLDYPRALFLETNTPAEAMRMVSLGKADAYVDGISTLNYLIVDKGYLDLAVTDAFDWEESGYYVAVGKHHPQLAAILTKALADLPPAEVEKLRAQWFSPRHQFGAVLLAYAYPAAGVAGVLTLGLILLVAWNRRLSREVALRTRAEAVAKDACQRAEEATRQKSEFLANMSHEIRTPMNAILGYAQLLKQDPSLPAPPRAQIATIDRAGKHLLAIINDILEMSRIEAGRSTLHESVVRLHDLIDEIIEFCAIRAREKGLSLTVEKDPALPRLIVSDEAKIRQCLINLVSNAVKFTATGGVTVAVAPEGAPAAAGQALRFTVSDTGPGLSEQDRDRLFQPFVQTATGARAGGTGLGLAISRRHARLMRGDITVTSTPGHGATFTLTLLTRPAPADSIPLAESSRRVLGVHADSKPVRILIADDQAETRDLMHALLEPLGFELRDAADGLKAVELFRSWKPHAILLETRLSVMAGDEVCRAVKSAPPGRECHLVALSASAFEDEKTRILAAGADAYRRKPFDVQELVTHLAAVLHLKLEYAPEPAPAAPPPAASDDQTELTRLPAGWSEEWTHACRAADIEALDRLCHRIETTHPRLHTRLRTGLATFDYPGLAAWISPPPKQP